MITNSQINEQVVLSFSDGNPSGLFWIGRAKAQVMFLLLTFMTDRKLNREPTLIFVFKLPNRSLDDVQMNLEVLKHCATVLFLVLNA